MRPCAWFSFALKVRTVLRIAQVGAGKRATLKIKITINTLSIFIRIGVRFMKQSDSGIIIKFVADLQNRTISFSTALANQHHTENTLSVEPTKNLVWRSSEKVGEGWKRSNSRTRIFGVPKSH